MKIRTKKRIAAAVGAICLLAVLGVVGGTVKIPSRGMRNRWA